MFLLLSVRVKPKSLTCLRDLALITPLTSPYDTLPCVCSILAFWYTSQTPTSGPLHMLFQLSATLYLQIVTCCCFFLIYFKSFPWFSFLHRTYNCLLYDLICFALLVITVFPPLEHKHHKSRNCVCLLMLQTQSKDWDTVSS